MPETATERKKKKPNRLAMIQRVIENLGSKLEGDKPVGSATAFVKLLQFEKELEHEDSPIGPREVIVTWVQLKEEDPIPVV